MRLPSSPSKVSTDSSQPSGSWIERTAIVLVLIGIGGKCVDTYFAASPPVRARTRHHQVFHEWRPYSRAPANPADFTVAEPIFPNDIATGNPESAEVVEEIPTEVLEETGNTVVMEMLQDGSLAGFYRRPRNFEAELRRRISELLPPNAPLEIATTEALMFLENNAEATAEAGDKRSAAYMINLTSHNTQRAVEIAMSGGDFETAINILRAQIGAVISEPGYFYRSCFDAHPDYIDSLWSLFNAQEREWVYQGLWFSIRMARDDLDGIRSPLLEGYQRIMRLYFPDRQG
ncbi:MAG: hypothetical protein HY817_03755 [Candidatus Abawacabacteria bacterium]|nr:hypothetical protein [Candidatus Abawacabacteria bacterium]